MKPFVFSVSGVKNSGKTTLITKLIAKFKEDGFKVATIKHDGHDFDLDTNGSDTYQHMMSGCDGTAIFSKNKYMIINHKKDMTEDFFIEHFSDMDIIILEGFKYKPYPKIEVVRAENGVELVCNQEGLFAIVTNVPMLDRSVPIIGLDDIEQIYEAILNDRKERYYD